MKVSALITNFNYGRYVGKAIESALAQSHLLSEVVVVDDGSTDDSRSVIERYVQEHTDRVIAVIQDNAGQAGAINRGFEHCTGDVICMLDADDIWDPQKVEQVAEAFVACPEASMVTHHYRHIDQAGNVLQADAVGRTLSGHIAELIARIGAVWFFPAMSGLSFRRGVLEQILPIPADHWRLCADGALVFPACFLGPVVGMPDVLGSYRIHGANNYTDAGKDPDLVQANVEMTHAYLNDFLTRIGRPERVDVWRNLHYRRDRYYRHGGGVSEVISVAKLILNWPLYSPVQRFKFLTRFGVKTLAAYGKRMVTA